MIAEAGMDPMRFLFTKDPHEAIVMIAVMRAVSKLREDASNKK